MNRLWLKLMMGGFIGLLWSVSFSGAGAGAEAGPSVISLTQVGCQFVEPEGRNLGFTPVAAADCEAINKKTGAERLSAHKVLELKPGKYVFRVNNENVPYELGFYLRSASMGMIPFLPRVSGAGVRLGETKDFSVTLTKGEYLYSCPYNPTPDYRLVVR